MPDLSPRSWSRPWLRRPCGGGHASSLRGGRPWNTCPSSCPSGRLSTLAHLRHHFLHDLKGTTALPHLRHHFLRHRHAHLHRVALPAFLFSVVHSTFLFKNCPIVIWRQLDDAGEMQPGRLNRGSYGGGRHSH